MTKMFVREEFEPRDGVCPGSQYCPPLSTGNARLDELMDAMTADGSGQASAQGDGATDSCSTDPSVSLRGDAADAGATSAPLTDADVVSLSGFRAKRDAERAPLPSNTVSETLRNALTTLKCAMLQVENPGRISTEGVVVFRDADIQGVREQLVWAIKQADLDRDTLETARKNVQIAMDEARRLDGLLAARERFGARTEA